MNVSLRLLLGLTASFAFGSNSANKGLSVESQGVVSKNVVQTQRPGALSVKVQLPQHNPAWIQTPTLTTYPTAYEDHQKHIKRSRMWPWLATFWALDRGSSSTPRGDRREVALADSPAERRCIGYSRARARDQIFDKRCIGSCIGNLRKYRVSHAQKEEVDKKSSALFARMLRKYMLLVKPRDANPLSKKLLYSTSTFLALGWFNVAGALAPATASLLFRNSPQAGFDVLSATSPSVLAAAIALHFSAHVAERYWPKASQVNGSGRGLRFASKA